MKQMVFQKSSFLNRAQGGYVLEDNRRCDINNYQSCSYEVSNECLAYALNECDGTNNCVGVDFNEQERKYKKK